MNTLINKALDILNETSAGDRFAERVALLKQGKKYEDRYVALYDKVKKTIPWTKKPTKSKSSALIEYTGEINGKRITFMFHEPDKNYSFSWHYCGVLVTEKGSYNPKYLRGKPLDCDSKGAIPTDAEYEQNLKDLQTDIDTIKKIK